MVVSKLAAMGTLGSVRAELADEGVVVASHDVSTLAIVVSVECASQNRTLFIIITNHHAITPNAFPPFRYPLRLLPVSDLHPRHQQQMQLDQLRL